MRQGITSPRPTASSNASIGASSEHLYREEIGDVIALRDEVEAYRELLTWVRPHETLGPAATMVRYLGDQPADPLDPTCPAPKVPEILTRNTLANVYVP